MPGGNDEETVIARDEAGRLTRRRPVRADDRDTVVHLTIDDDAVRCVNKAVARTDPQGNPVLKDGVEVNRWSTVLDAVNRSARGRVPTLCHQAHTTPAGVCRVCVVGLADVEKPDRVKLMPACYHPVFQKKAEDEAGGRVRMAVHTLFARTERHRLQVRAAVAGVFELLAGDHVHPDSPAPRDRYENELTGVADTLLRSWELFPPAPGSADEAARDRVRAVRALLEPLPGLPRPDARYGALSRDRAAVDAAPAAPFVVDRNNCVLCDRCVRACGEVRPFRVIARAGKGADTRIAFDLHHLPMAASTCRACGECMTACPTGAITFRAPVRPDPPATAVGTAALRARFPFLEQVPLAFLEWNRGAVRTRPFARGEVLARQGDFGAVAFVVTRGLVGVYRKNAQPHESLSKENLARLRGLDGYRRYGEPLNVIPAHPSNLVGEMSPMSHDPRLATLVGLEPGEVLEVERNVLHVLLRDPARRAQVEAEYRRRAILDVFDQLDEQSRDPAAADLLFGGPDPAVRASLAAFVTAPANLARLRLLDYQPGEVICEQGENPVAVADERRNGVFLIRRGFVNVCVSRPGGEPNTLLPMGRPQCVGDLAVLSARLWTEAEWAAIPDRPRHGVRAATCTALSPVELVRIPADVFLAWVDAEPGFHAALRRRCLRIWGRRWA